MKTINLENKGSDNKEYFYIIIDKQLKQIFAIKNASCSASIFTYLSKKHKIEYADIHIRFSIVFSNLFIDTSKIPKKYAKFEILPFIETEIQKACKVKFYGVSNVELVSRFNSLPDFKHDNEDVELIRRMQKSGGKFQVFMNYNTLRIIQDIN
jgi:hypothetical protein